MIEQEKDKPPKVTKAKQEIFWRYKNPNNEITRSSAAKTKMRHDANNIPKPASSSGAVNERTMSFLQVSFTFLNEIGTWPVNMQYV